MVFRKRLMILILNIILGDRLRRGLLICRLRLFSLVSAANCAGVDLDVALEKVLKKYEDRFNKKGHIGSED